MRGIPSSLQCAPLRNLDVDIAIIVSTFERLGHLRRCLASLEAQRGVSGQFEVVVTDDGSRDGTVEFLREACARVPFPLRFTTHDHLGFRLAMCRNRGVAATTAPYILFTDGDCILPPDHVRTHLAARKRGRVVGGDSVRLDRSATESIDEAALRRGEFPRIAPPREMMRIGMKSVRAKIYETLRTPMRPRLTGNNIGVWRCDLERVNGFDEAYEGWGFEDRDLQYRLERVGLRVWSILARTRPMHLWHEPHPTFARNGVGTQNGSYYGSLERRPAFCVHGLSKRASGIACVPDPISVDRVPEPTAA